MAVELLPVLKDLQVILPIRPISLRTGIAQWRLKNYFDGSVIPYQPTLNRLNRAYRSIQYFRLRNAGLSPRQAKRFWSDRNYKVESIINSLNRISEKIASDLDKITVDANDIKEGFAMSDMSPEQLADRYK